MKHAQSTLLAFLLSAFAAAHAQVPDIQATRALFALTNQIRAEHHLAPFTWDPALATAAQAHALRLAKEPGSLEHQYPGEPELLTRAANAGAHFSVISENLARGRTSPFSLEELWMSTPIHRSNLLSPGLTAIGISVLNRDGILYAVQDFSRASPSANREAVEARVIGLLHQQGLHDASASQLARDSCVQRASTAPGALLIVQWDGDTTSLPNVLIDQLRRSIYRSAAVGACSTASPPAGFTAARVAVLLF